MTSISAIVPTYNRAGYLAQAVNALQAQTLPVTEIIVWDDGSTDETGQIAKALPGIRYFRSDNGGKSRALNAALRKASGDLIWICDDDDIALPDAAKTLAGLLAEHPQAGYAGGSYRRFRDGADGERTEAGPGYWPDLTNGTPIRHLLEDIFLFQNATLVRRSLYDRAGPFREDLARSIDYDMIVRLGLLAPGVVTNKALFLQRKHDGDRGPAAARHAAARSDNVWKSADRGLFADLHPSIPLTFYEAMFDASEPDLVRRAALLQRGCVHARRTDWSMALQDLQAAAECVPDTVLSAVERAICLRAMAGKHGIDEALETATRRDLIALGHMNGAGGAITRGLARGLLWRGRSAFKAGQGARAGAIFRLIVGLTVAGKTPRGPIPDLRERRDIPATAFLETWPTSERHKT